VTGVQTCALPISDGDEYTFGKIINIRSLCACLTNSIARVLNAPRLNLPTDLFKAITAIRDELEMGYGNSSTRPFTYEQDRMSMLITNQFTNHGVSFCRGVTPVQASHAQLNSKKKSKKIPHAPASAQFNDMELVVRDYLSDIVNHCPFFVSKTSRLHLTDAHARELSREFDSHLRGLTPSSAYYGLITDISTQYLGNIKGAPIPCALAIGGVADLLEDAINLVIQQQGYNVPYITNSWGTHPLNGYAPPAPTASGRSSAAQPVFTQQYNQQAIANGVAPFEDKVVNNTSLTDEHIKAIRDLCIAADNKEACEFRQTSNAKNKRKIKALPKGA